MHPNFKFCLIWMTIFACITLRRALLETAKQLEETQKSLKSTHERVDKLQKVVDEIQWEFDRIKELLAKKFASEWEIYWRAFVRHSQNETAVRDLNAGENLYLYFGYDINGVLQNIYI